MGLSGLLLVLLGILLALNPVSGTPTVSCFIGFYALLAGTVLTLLGFRLRKL